MKCRLCYHETEPFLSVSTSEFDEPFLDSTLRSKLPQLLLSRCSDCKSLWANDSRTDAQTLIDAYQRVDDRYFESQTSQAYMKFYHWLEALVLPHVSGTKILDLGCGDGAFLSAISEQWVKLGLEPSKAGVQFARQKNLDVSCGTLANLPNEHEIDLLVLLDVIEHIVDPHEFVTQIKSKLKSGGIVLVLTGDADSTSARIAGPQWSYLRWCGHVSVFSKKSLQQLFTDHDFEIVDWKRCEHPSTPGLVAWWRVYLLEGVRQMLGRQRSWYPFWRDHQVVLARVK
jgi:2-polyprenyl-3-methyl-5-hydroxy-6-metoxy-1,4-benzoquinol methylase